MSKEMRNSQETLDYKKIYAIRMVFIQEEFGMCTPSYAFSIFDDDLQKQVGRCTLQFWFNSTTENLQHLTFYHFSFDEGFQNKDYEISVLIWILKAAEAFGCNSFGIQELNKSGYFMNALKMASIKTGEDITDIFVELDENNRKRLGENDFSKIQLNSSKHALLKLKGELVKKGFNLPENLCFEFDDKKWVANRSSLWARLEDARKNLQKNPDDLETQKAESQAQKDYDRCFGLTLTS